MADLFDPSPCNLPSIPDMTFDFVEDCNVLPAPGPILDCPPMQIPFDTPLIYECLDYEGQATISVSEGEPSVDLVVTRNEENTDACETIFDFSFQLPPGGGDELPPEETSEDGEDCCGCSPTGSFTLQGMDLRCENGRLRVYRTPTIGSVAACALSAAPGAEVYWHPAGCCECDQVEV